MKLEWRGEQRWVVAMAAVSLVLGAMLGVQVHARRLRGATASGRQARAVVGMLTAAETQLENQRAEIQRLREQLARYEQEAADERGLTRLMKEELETFRIMLGVLPVQGPGVELVLDDSTMRVDDKVGGQEVYVIHDFDLVQIANELWAAGAEAISLNGQRLVTGSAIACSARLITVNNVAISRPFTFLAIGNKANMVSALNIRDGLLDRLRVLQFHVKLTPRDEIIIPALSVMPKYQYAQPVVAEEASR